MMNNQPINLPQVQPANNNQPVQPPNPIMVKVTAAIGPRPLVTPAPANGATTQQIKAAWKSDVVQVNYDLRVMSELLNEMQLLITELSTILGNSPQNAQANNALGQIGNAIASAATSTNQTVGHLTGVPNLIDNFFAVPVIQNTTDQALKNKIQQLATVNFNFRNQLNSTLNIQPQNIHQPQGQHPQRQRVQRQRVQRQRVQRQPVQRQPVQLQSVHAQQPLAQQPLAQQPLAQQPLAQQPLAQQPQTQQLQTQQLQAQQLQAQQTQTQQTLNPSNIPLNVAPNNSFIKKILNNFSSQSKNKNNQTDTLAQKTTRIQPTTKFSADQILLGSEDLSEEE